jgi:hypothetical protein
MNKNNVNTSKKISGILNEGTTYRIIETKAPAAPKPTSNNSKNK